MTVSAESKMELETTTTVDFPRFGEFTYTADEVLEFPWGVPGFPEHRRWLALTIESQPSFVWLQSLDDLKVALPTTNPWMIYEEYDPKLPTYAIHTLAIQAPSDFTFLCVLVVTDGAKEMTVNLMAPIVINLRTRKARQIMLENSGYSVREAVPRKAIEVPPADAPTNT